MKELKKIKSIIYRNDIQEAKNYTPKVDDKKAIKFFVDENLFCMDVKYNKTLINILESLNLTYSDKTDLIKKVIHCIHPSLFRYIILNIADKKQKTVLYSESLINSRYDLIPFIKGIGMYYYMDMLRYFTQKYNKKNKAIIINHLEMEIEKLKRKKQGPVPLGISILKSNMRSRGGSIVRSRGSSGKVFVLSIKK